MLVAADFLESRTLQGLAGILGPTFEQRSCLDFGQIRPPPLNLETDIAASDIVVITVSNACGREVLAAKAAVEQRKLLVMVALGYQSWANEEFAAVRPFVRLLFVVDEEERQRAALLYPDATILVVGHPEWESFAFPTRTRDEVREILGIGPEQKFVLVSGEKEMGVNFALGACVIEALASLPRPEAFRLVFTIHPGHGEYPGRTANVGLIELYKELEAYDPKVHTSISLKTGPFGLGTNDMVPGADIVIGTASTIQIQAAFMRIPAIALLTQRAFRGREMPVKHAGWWPPVDKGAVAGIYGINSEQLANHIGSLLTPNGFAAMRAAQERAFVPAEVGSAYKKMKGGLMELLTFNPDRP